MKTFIKIFLLIFLYSCSSNGVTDDEKITISGAFALYPLAVKWADEFKKEHPNIKIDISAGGAGKGMTDVLFNMVDLAMVSREIVEEEKIKGAWELAVARDAVIPVINSNSDLCEILNKRGLTRNEFKELFTGEKTMGEILGINSAISVYTRSDACGAAEMWAAFFEKHQEDLIGTGVFGDPGMAMAIISDKNAIGFNNIIYAYNIGSRKAIDGLMAIPIDLNENGRIDPEEFFYDCLDSLNAAIVAGVFPMPPARNLYFVSNGKPTNKGVILFLEWILKNGHNYVDAAGYTKIPDDLIKIEKKKLLN